MKDIYLSTISRLNWYAFLCLLLSLPYGMEFGRFFWIVWLVTWLLEGRFLSRPVLTDKRLMVPFAGLAVWFVWNMLSVAWAPDKTTAWLAVLRYVNVICLVPIVLWGVNKHYRWQTCLKVLVIGAAVSVLVYLFAHYWTNNYMSALNKQNPRNYSIDFLRLNDLLLDMKHRFHYTNVLLMAFVGVFFMLPDAIKKYGKQRTYVLSVLTCLWFALAIYWTGSRMGLINLAAVVCLFLFLRLQGRKRYVGSVFLVLLFAGFALSLHLWQPRQQDTPHERWLHYDANEAMPAYEPRIAIWHAVVENHDAYPWYGLGVNQSRDFLVERYKERGWTYYAQLHYGPHNQYFTLWMELGFPAALLFIILWASIPFCFQGKARRFATFFTLITLLGMCTETLLSGLEGILFCCVMLFLCTQFPAQKESLSETP